MTELLDFLRTHEEAFRSRARLASLYSDFRSQRQTNPAGYQANASAWLRALTAAAKAGLIPAQAGSQHDRFTLHTGEELLRGLQTTEFGRPLALGSVLEDAVRKGQLIPVREFLDAKKSVYAKSWVPTPWQVVGWSLRQLGVTGREGVEDRLVKGDFVVMANIEDAAKTVLDQAVQIATSNASRVFSKDLFISTFSPAVGVDALSTRDTAVLLTHLVRDRAAIAYDETSGTIKFKTTSQTAPAAIEQEDITIASLRTLITGLEPQIEQLTQRISELDAKAREAVAKKQLVTAKTALRQKKLAETKLQQRTTTLMQTEEVYAKIEQAADQVEMVRVMEASSQTLRALNQKTGGVERVQDVMEGLRDEMTSVDEIQQAINEGSAGAVDEGEVEDELEAIEKAERERLEAVERRAKEVKEAEEAERTRWRLAELDQVAKHEATEKVQLGERTALPQSRTDERPLEQA
ncbi:hypothetical protein LTR91_005020 [Friedmanniomyces endolithicus]|uniref:SNF7 family protein n=1 Tax=Friedmanniomyces endolithicus TaxID=329885 RepID=A0AAN6QXX3_9PEZI|nr:hypothetical protein LTS09_000095 [Friedmanniomyces endolithicus]KAK0357207.1 hypothetical protein LTR94_001760 [Friedmanniomyces endolithicus]KAK0786840.1 hypothetical protein LTR38_011891 [Friedmanniomyces endolithicus]KAK0807971.1 hypothetical protein LTR59_003030 [Friedmanniomyces endolithicus]KAK0820831.1 hypothetical protein LTR75_001417 [Friedmanniomyces endolithicus]